MDKENKYGLFECQQNLLKLMGLFDKLCLENNITYAADSGTLLGAIRHNGFIPWDDDLDVVVDRDNYNRLMSIDLAKYGLQRVRKTFIESLCFTDETVLNTSPVLDIFILDKTPDNALMRKWKLAKIMMVHGLWHHHNPPKNYSKSIVKRLYSFVFSNLGRLFTEEQVFKMFQRVSIQGNGKATRNVQCYNYLTKELHVVYPADILNEIERHRFESLEINIPKSYDTYLCRLYGENYMTPIQTK